MKNPKNFWDSFTGRYQMGAQKHRVYLLDLLASRGVKSILDVGCGTGPIWEMIKTTTISNYDEHGHDDPEPRWLFKYKGTDYSQGMIEVCKQEFPEAEWEVQDARKLKEKDNSWDCVLLLHALDHLDDYQAAIREAARVTSKYVCIVLWRGFTTTGENSLNDRNMMNKEEGDEPWEDTHLQEYSKERLEEEFKKNGLVVEHIAEGEALNSDASHYNFLYLLRKNGKTN